VQIYREGVCMIKEFNRLTDPEVEIMLKAPVLVCILIAGADGNIDKKEIREAITFAQKRKDSKNELAFYFREVSQDFEDKIKIMIQSYPFQPDQRAPIITRELSQLNNILKKIDNTFAVSFYKMLKDIAEKIAASSGGLLGIKTVGEQEAQFLKLSMIENPAKN
jgi:hypothetical protein